MGITCEDKCEEAEGWVMVGGIAEDQSAGGEADQEEWVVVADEDAVRPVATVVVAAARREIKSQENKRMENASRWCVADEAESVRRTRAFAPTRYASFPGLRRLHNADVR